MTCQHGMPSVASCVDCMQTQGIPQPKEEADGPVIDALSWGRCGACGEMINIGDAIVHTTKGRWVHEEDV